MRCALWAVVCDAVGGFFGRIGGSFKKDRRFFRRG